MLLLSAALTTHSFTPFTRPFLTAEALAFACTPTKAGIATAERIAKTAITTTSSTSENPSSPGLVANVFNLFRV